MTRLLRGLGCAILVLSSLASTQGQDRARQRPDAGALKIGDVAPDFTLKSLDGAAETTLSDFKDQKPVVLIFGSYT